MTLLPAGYFSFATRRPGPPGKVYPIFNVRNGWVGHSMEGWFATNDTLDDPTRGSWHGTILVTGELKQHYSTLASPFASGNKVANTQYCAWELEGLVGSPMNAAQLATAITMYKDWREDGLPELVRGVNLFDHNEVATRWAPNAGPTACPSNRWAPFYTWLAKQEDDEMTEDQVLALIDSRLLTAKHDAVVDEVSRLGSAQIDAVAALVSRQRAMGRATTLAEVIAANDPEVIPA